MRGNTRRLLWLSSLSSSHELSFACPLRRVPRAGVKFAQPDRDELAPVFTPPPNVSTTSTAQHSQRHAGLTNAVQSIAASLTDRLLLSLLLIAGWQSKLLADRVAGIASSRTSRQSGSSTVQSSAASPASSAPSSNRSSMSAISSSSIGLPPAASVPSSSSSLADPPLIYTTVPSFRDAELSATWEQCKLLLEILDNSDTAEAVAQDEIVNMLVKDLRKAQETVLAKLQRPTVNDRVDQLLACNDVLVNTFTYYDGLSQGTMRRRNAQDEARRAAAEEDLVFAERPHVRRANSFNMESHDVRLVRDSQDPNAAVHQYSSEAKQPSFSYATPAQQPSLSHARSPSGGESASHRSDGSASASSSALGTFLTHQPQRTNQQQTDIAAAHHPSTQQRGEQFFSPVQATPLAAYSPEPYRMEASQPTSHSGSAAAATSAQQLQGASNSQKSRSSSPIAPRNQPPQQFEGAPTAPPAAQQSDVHGAAAMPAKPAMPTVPAVAPLPAMSAAVPVTAQAMPTGPAGAPSPFAPFPMAAMAPGTSGNMPAMSPEQYAQWMGFMQQQMAMMHQAMQQQQQQQQGQQQPFPAAAQAPQSQQGEAGGGAVQPQQQQQQRQLGEPVEQSAVGEQGEQAQGERGEEADRQFSEMRLAK